MHQLLVKDGILAGVLFDRYFESDLLLAEAKPNTTTF
jgi:hypothetical protein